MVNHGQTMVLPLTDHGRPWLLTMINRGKNMVDHGLTVVLTQGRVCQSTVVMSTTVCVFQDSRGRTVKAVCIENTLSVLLKLVSA